MNKTKGKEEKIDLEKIINRKNTPEYINSKITQDVQDLGKEIDDLLFGLNTIPSDENKADIKK